MNRESSLHRDGVDAHAMRPDAHRMHDRRRAYTTVVGVVVTSSLLVALGIGTGQGAESAREHEELVSISSSPGAEEVEAPIVSPSVAEVGDQSTDASAEQVPSSAPIDPGSATTALAASVTEVEATLAGPEVEVVRAPIEERSFNGRPIRPARILSMRVTAYSPHVESCGDSADGITASGYSVETNGGHLVAADPKLLPLGSLVSVPGYANGQVVPVLDVGGAIKGHRLDVLYATHAAARNWGVKQLEVIVWEYADGRGSEFRKLRRPKRA